MLFVREEWILSKSRCIHKRNKYTNANEKFCVKIWELVLLEFNKGFVPPVSGGEMEYVMAKIFTNYPETSDADFGSDEKAESKKYKKLKAIRKSIKKERKRIQKLKMLESTVENEGVSKTHGGEREKSFFAKVGDALLTALPSIFRTTAKTIVTTLCEYALKKWMRKVQVA